MDLRQIRTSPDDFGMMTYDPAFTNTACCESKVTLIDGDKGILRYRGYDIEELAENCISSRSPTCLSTANSPIPREEAVSGLTRSTTACPSYENIKKFMEGFRYDAHPMGMLVSTVAALSTFYPDSKNVRDTETRKASIYRLIGKMPIIAAYAYPPPQGSAVRLSRARPQLHRKLHEHAVEASQLKYLTNPVLAHALDVLLILHADHEQNCSTNAMRAVGSSEADPVPVDGCGGSALWPARCTAARTKKCCA